MRNIVIQITAALAIALAPAACAQTAPDGWKTERPAPGIVAFVPPDLGAGEVFRIAVYPPASLGNKAIADWLQAEVDKDPLKHAGNAPTQMMGQSADAAVGVRLFALPTGAQAADLYTVSRRADGTARLVRVTMSTQGSVATRYKAAMEQVIRETRQGQAQTSITAGAEQAPAAGTGKAVRGGPVKPGLYVGDEVCTGIGGKELWRNHWRLSLYADGEWRVADEHDKPPRYSDTGRYKYDPRTGKMDIDGSFHLSSDGIDPGDALCVYGRDGAGTPLIVGKDNINDVSAVLRYAGPAPRLAPDAEARAKAAQEAEARRYKWVTPPGQGVKDAQIAAVVHNYQVQVYYGGSGLGTNIRDEPYLLLKDGTVHDGLPVAPDQMDVPLSRRREPEKWGRWRRAGGKFLVSWGGGAEPYKPLPGKAVLPGAPGTRLAGRWGAGESSSSLMGGSYRLFGVTFSKDGRFVKDMRGGSGNSQFMQTGGAPAIGTEYDDNGSSTAVLGGNFTVAASRKGGPASHRSGTYAIKGWTMTLRYDDGRVERMPFFFADPAHEELYFEGTKLGRDDDKK